MKGGNGMEQLTDMKYLKLLAHEYPTIAEVSTEIINLKAILNLPKGTEHFISDIHGEYEAFIHMLKNASGVIRKKIDILFENTVTEAERNTLATLIYYPVQKLDQLKRAGVVNAEWYKITLRRMVEVCRFSASKYTRSKVRKALPESYAYIIDELLHAIETEDKVRYNNEIIRSIIETEQADTLITALSNLIQRLVIDRLHIVGDVFDRGPGAHIIMDRLLSYHTVDIQWGNHDILWMGASAGNRALIATAIINSLKYGNVDTIEDGYGISLSPLLKFALETYADDPCTKFLPREVGDAHHDNPELIAKMHKAMAIILFKLEGQIIEKNPDYHMEHRRMLHRVDYERGTMVIDGVEYELADKRFPTVLPSDPYVLTEQEEDLMDKLRTAFYHSGKIREHTKFLFSHGSMYLVCNGNLLFHGCVPSNPDGTFASVTIDGRAYAGKALFDKADALVRQGFFTKWGTPEREQGLDFFWYMWCGTNSPLFGKDKMTTFERYFIEDKTTHEEHKNPYFKLAEHEDFAVKILEAFGLSDDPDSHIINGHVPVKIKKGESPIKANGRIFVIDGGMSKAYQSTTGIAGYTLIYNSQCMILSCHDPFVTVNEAIRTETDIHSTQQTVYTPTVRKRVADTDVGKTLLERIDDLTRLLAAYRSGAIKEHSR